MQVIPSSGASSYIGFIPSLSLLLDCYLPTAYLDPNYYEAVIVAHNTGLAHLLSHELQAVVVTFKFCQHVCCCLRTAFVCFLPSDR